MDEPEYDASMFKAELAAVRSELNALRTDVKDLVAAWLEFWRMGSMVSPDTTYQEGPPVGSLRM